MGIKNLMKLLVEKCPGAIKESLMKNYFGRKVAVDASMSIYQFMLAIYTDDTNTFSLTDSFGATTNHLNGIFYRTVRMMINGVKPIYVFDGKPPTMKGGELAKRSQKRKEAEEAKTEAKEEGDKEALAKANKRTVRVTKEHNEEVKKLLRLMGVPIVESPCEAEAQCAELVKSGVCYATATEDMDSLTLGTPILLRHMTASEAKKIPVLEINLKDILKEMDFTMDMFIDLCILLGCDYCDTIRGIGTKRAFEMIEKHKNIETVIENLDKEKYPLPENFPYKEVRPLFTDPEVIKADTLELKWTDPDEEGLLKYMVEEKGFGEDKIKSALAKLKKSKTNMVQERLTSFFKVVENGNTSPTKKKPDTNSKKRKGTGGGAPPAKRLRK